MKATHKFSQLSYWNLETPPSNNDTLVKALQWINIASAVSRGSTVRQVSANLMSCRDGYSALAST